MKKVLVVGSGAGGATVAREIALRGVEVLVLEKGIHIDTENAHQCYDNMDVGVELLKTSCLGGTTLVTAGNAVRTCQKELKSLGVDLEDEFMELEEELGVGILPPSLIGEGTRKIMEAASSMGLTMKGMPKFINPEKCVPCGKCTFGCPRNAKWSSLRYLEDALRCGAIITCNTPVTRVITSHGRVKGVESYGKFYEADVVVLSAGAIETPRLLQRAGLDAGNHLFVDTFVTVGGVLQNVKFNREVSMNSLHIGDGFILAPHYSTILLERLKHASEEDILGMMVKIRDESSGKVEQNAVYKYTTSRDAGLLTEGSALAGSVLTVAGVDPKTLVSTPARGAHPGGTAAIGEVVDSNLETEIEGLFVADASVFPRAPGAPPILTIMALAKRLAHHLTDNG